MVEPLTYIFMGISFISVAVNIPLIKKFKNCSCTHINGEMKCNSSCKTDGTKIPPQIKNICKDYNGDEQKSDEEKK
jgi:hypothetical protein